MDTNVESVVTTIERLDHEQMNLEENMDHQRLSPEHMNLAQLFQLQFK